MKFDELQPHIKRRVDFLLSEARAGSPRDQVITYTMRVLSNHASIGSDEGSMQIKKLNRRISLAALDSLRNWPKSLSFDNWAKNTVNEHPKPLKETWAWLLEKASKITSEQVWDEFLAYPMVIVLKSEDDTLKDKGLRAKSGAIHRYLEAGIEVVELDRTPEDSWKNNNFQCKRIQIDP